MGTPGSTSRSWAPGGAVGLAIARELAERGACGDHPETLPTRADEGEVPPSISASYGTQSNVEVISEFGDTPHLVQDERFAELREVVLEKAEN